MATAWTLIGSALGGQVQWGGVVWGRGRRGGVVAVWQRRLQNIRPDEVADGGRFARQVHGRLLFGRRVG